MEDLQIIQSIIKITPHSGADARLFNKSSRDGVFTLSRALSASKLEVTEMFDGCLVFDKGFDSSFIFRDSII